MEACPHPIKQILSLPPPYLAYGLPPYPKIFGALCAILSPYIELFTQIVFYQIKDKMKFLKLILVELQLSQIIVMKTLYYIPCYFPTIPPH